MRINKEKAVSKMTNEMDKFSKILKRKRRRRFLVFAFLLMLLTAAVVICALIFFSVKTIKVDNETRYDTSEVLRTAGVSTGDFLLGIKEDRLRNKILKDFPYIAEVDFKTSYPDILNLGFISAVPFYSVGMEDGTILYLDKNFKVLDKSSENDKNTLLIKGMDVESFEPGTKLTSENSLEVEVLDNILENLDKFDLTSQLKSVDFTKKYNTIINLDDRIEVEIGTSSDIDRKIQLLVNILEKNKTDKKMSISVRNYTQGRCRILD